MINSLKLNKITGSHESEYEDNSHMGYAVCNLVDVDRRFGGSYCLHHQGYDDGGSTHV
jgi:hypothetical protein